EDGHDLYGNVRRPAAGRLRAAPDGCHARGSDALFAARLGGGLVGVDRSHSRALRGAAAHRLSELRAGLLRSAGRRLLDEARPAGVARAVTEPRAVREIRVLADAALAALAAADLVVTRAAEGIAARGAFRLALSGGRTPEATYRTLGRAEFRAR